MKKLLPIFMLIFTVTGFAQTTRKDGIETRYDKFKDETTISAISPDEHLMSEIMFSHDTKTLTADAEHFYIFFSGSCRGFCFNDAVLILLIDGERVPAGRDEGLSDSAIFAIDRPMLKRIANAKLVEYQVGGIEGKWNDKAIAKFKTLLGLGTVKK